MRCDHLTYAIGVDEADVEHEGDEVLTQDHGLKVEVGGDDGPGGEERDEAVECGRCGFFALTSGGHDVCCARDGVEDED